MINIRKLFILLNVIMVIGCSFLFSLTDGLIDNSTDIFVKNLMITGSDDNICIEVARFLFFPLLTLSFTIKKRISIWEFLLTNLIMIFQFVLVLAIEAGSILKTIENGNIPLSLWWVSYILLFVEIYVFFFYEHFFKKLNK